MIFQPLIYFVALSKSNDSKPIFASIDSTSDNFYTLCGFENVSPDYHDLNIIWYDFEKCCFFQYSTSLPQIDAGSSIFIMIIISGAVCIWYTYAEQTLTLSDFHCKQLYIDVNNKEWDCVRISKQEKYNVLRGSISPSSEEFYRTSYNLMKRYVFRFMPVVYGNYEIDITSIKEMLKDGSILKLDEEKIFKYQEVAVPQKISFDFLMEADEYQGYFWFEDYLLVEQFSRFYGAHPETKTDFIIRIDAENKKYELALYRQGLKEPVAIPPSAYQLIVFKNKFEDYRSENYNQPRGAWIW